MKDYEQSPYFVWYVHLDGDKQDHDKSVCQEGTYDRAVAAIKAAKAKGFRCNINCTLFNNDALHVYLCVPRALAWSVASPRRLLEWLWRYQTRRRHRLYWELLACWLDQRAEASHDRAIAHKV